MNNFFNNVNMAALPVCFIIAMAASSISITISMTEVFAPLRAWAAIYLGHMLSYLFQCFYCLSHWIVFLGIFIYRPILIHSGYLIVDLIVSVFATVTLASLITGLTSKAFSTVIIMKMRENELKQIMAKQ